MINNKMKTHVVTYASHDDGTLQELLNNKHGVKVELLGFGSKWNGFTDKIKGVYKYIIEKTKDDDILIFLDGFDSKILKPLDVAIRRFRKMNAKILLSKEQIHNPQKYWFLERFFKYTANKVFGNCKDGIIANSGLYMGYIKYLKPFLKNVLEFRPNEKCKSDQRKFNMLCKKYNNEITIDLGNLIFHNCPNDGGNCDNSDACFVQYPAQITLKRGLRALQEYFSIFIFELVVIIALILLIIYIIYRIIKR